MTYARQAKQTAALEVYTDATLSKAAEDERRANERMKQDELTAKAREAAARQRRAELRQECMDVLAIQIREKQVRAQAERDREGMVVARELQDLRAAEGAEKRRQEICKSKNMAYAAELSEQMHMQETRKLIEPYLMSRPERQMNAALLRRLPS